jgi:hypothetical protein
LAAQTPENHPLHQTLLKSIRHNTLILLNIFKRPASIFFVAHKSGGGFDHAGAKTRSGLL